MDFGLGYKDFTRIFWTFVQTFAATAFTLATGLGRFPNLSEAKALLWAAVLAGLAAALSALKNFVLGDASSVK